MSPGDDRIGPYRIEAELARGGMGIVYRARHEASGVDVALKTVRVAEAWLVGGIRREIHALSRLHHPGVVRVLDHGMQGAVPWYAMELVIGPTMREVFGTLRRPGSSLQATVSDREVPHGTPTQAITGHEPQPFVLATPLGVEHLREALALVRRVCAPLSYIHGEGLVHRDLKPDNVLIRSDGSPVLVDFGLAAAQDPHLFRESLDPPPEGLGTLDYLAPEQADLVLVDARADLYALGCILYEMLTGRPPFLGVTIRDLVQQHRTRAPIPPTELVPALPAELDALVLRLLAQDPRQRIGHADVVARALAVLGADGEPGEGPWGRAYLYRPGFAGRSDALADLAQRLPKRSQDVTVALTLLRGESGVGKTRLMGALAGRAQRARAKVIACECLPHADGAPGCSLARLLAAIGDRCRERGLDETSRLLGRNGKVLATHEPAIGALPGVASEPEPVELPPAAAHVRFARVLGDALTAFAAAEPLLLVIDDLQWADEVTMSFLSWLARAELRAPVTLVASFRKDETTDALDDLLRAPAVSVVDLGRLGDGAVGLMVADMLGVPSAPSSLVRFVARASEGNPFFVAEYLKTAVAEELLFRNEQGQWALSGGSDPEKLALPQALRDLVGRRLAGVGDQARAVLLTAASMGREVDPAILARAVALPEDDLMAGISELVARQILEETEGRLRFVHDKIVEVATDGIPAPDRGGVHLRIAEAMEADALRSEERVAALALHFARGADGARARTYYLQAARMAADRYAQREAEALFRTALALEGTASVETVMGRIDLAREVLARDGRIAEAREHVKRALDQSRALGDRDLEFKSLLELTYLYVRESDLEMARVHVPRLEELLPEDPPTRCSALGGLALVLQFVDRIPHSQRVYEEAVALARKLCIDAPLGNTLGNYGVCLQWARRWGQARAAYEESLGIARRVGDRRLEFRDVINLATLDRREGRIDRARAHLESALSIARELGDRYDEVTVLQNLGEVLLDQGHLDDAQKTYGIGLSMSRETGHRRCEGSILQGLGQVALDLGDPDRGIPLYAQAIELHRATGDRKMEALTLAEEVRLHGARGDLATARRRHAEARAIAAEAGDPEPAALADLSLGSVLRSAGELAEARELFERCGGWTESEGERFWVLRLHCERALLAIAQGGDAAPHAARAKALASEIESASGFRLSGLVAALG